MCGAGSMLEAEAEGVGGSEERDMLVLKTWSLVGELVSSRAVMKVMLSKGMEELAGPSIFLQKVRVD